MVATPLSRIAFATAFVVGLAATGCGGGKQPAAPAPTPAPPAADAPKVPAGGEDLSKLPPTPPAPDRAAELFPPLWKAVGRGQTVSFATAAIDQDLDDTRVEVTTMPPSARFDALTQTVTWTPTRKEKTGTFVLEVTDLAHDERRDVTWTIPVAKTKVAAPVAPWAGDAAELLFTVRDPKRLEATNKALPFDQALLAGATMMRAALAPAVQAKLAPLDAATLFNDFLVSLARTHGNPRLDPSSPSFDKASFGDPKAWRLVTFRPRIDKKFHELRLVYRAVKAPEPVFAMFRLRAAWDVPTLPPEARIENNKVFAGLLWKHLLTADGGLDPTLVKDARTHGQHVAAFVQELITYQGPQPWAQAAFVALPTEARMGGGSARNDDGSYASGDGWAWSVQKPMVAADGSRQRYVEIGIPGFWTHTVPSADGASWVPTCAPRFDPDHARHVAGYEVLCRRALGFVDLPAVVDGKVVTAKVDAINLFVDHKRGAAVELLALDDGRRDHGEENGMTCAQCHMRTFGVRDYGDPATADPRVGTPRLPNRALPTLNFQIVPGERWEAFTLELMQDQECKARVNLEAALGKPSKLTCKLADPAAVRVDAPLAP